MNATDFDEAVGLATLVIRGIYDSRGPRRAIIALRKNCSPRRPYHRGYQILKRDFEHLVDGGLSPERAIRVLIE